VTAAELRAILAEIGMKQVECAKHLGIDQRTIRRYVADTPIPRVVELAIQHMRLTMRIDWTPEQIDTLKALYGTTSAKEVAEKVGKTVSAVYAKANNLNLHRYKVCDPSPPVIDSPSA
jgi:DNA-binding transcriptional regulator LsrR (DeoR family)